METSISTKTQPIKTVTLAAIEGYCQVILSIDDPRQKLKSFITVQQPRSFNSILPEYEKFKS